MPSATARSASTPPTHRSRGRGAFVKQFIVNTSMVGAIAPSSPHLANEMLREMDLGRARAVLEFGPGTGVFTDAIIPRLGKQTRFVPIELNDEMARNFRKRHPSIELVHESVVNARRICDERGIEMVDHIVSGLPWASFPESLQRSILDAIRSVLKPGGTMATFGYHIGTLLPAGKRFYRILPEYFSKSQRSRIIWRNVPPAFVVHCVR